MLDIKKDQLGSVVLLFIGIAAIIAALIYEDSRSSFSNPDAWYHLAAMLSGAVLITIAPARFLLIFLGPKGLPFRNEDHFYNWLFLFLLGLGLVIYELKLDQDWFRN